MRHGKRSGLWWEFLRLIEEIEPEWVFLENVPGIFHSPNSGVEPDDETDGEFADESVRNIDAILGPLSALWFDAEWLCLRASDVGASHKRERWFCLAYRPGARCAGSKDGSANRDDALTDGRGSVESERGRGALEHAESSGRSQPEQTGFRTDEAEVAAGMDHRPERAGSVVADPAVAGLPIRRYYARDSGEALGKPPAERTEPELADAERRGLGERGERSGSAGQPDGNNLAMADAGHGQLSEPRRGVCEASEQLPAFAPRPADPDWPALLVRFPWLRPSYSQAEAQSDLRDVADELAALVVDGRAAALRAGGNGVVDLQAAEAFIELAERAGMTIFAGSIPGRPNVGAVDAESRIRMVQTFSIEQCNQALHIPGIQKSVALAIVRRVRKIKTEASGVRV